MMVVRLLDGVDDGGMYCVQAYRAVWSHNVRVRVQLYVRLPAQGPRRRRRAAGYHEQVRRSFNPLMHKVSKMVT